jgi:DNA-binding MarR family transcriptional regulator
MPTIDATTELASMLRLSVMRLSRRLRAERADHSLTLTQIAALSTLDQHGPLTPRELADYEHVQPPSMTRVLTTLESLGLVTRTPHPTDGRQHLMARTARGAALLAEDRRRREAWLARRLAELSATERATLRASAEILHRLAAA